MNVERMKIRLIMTHLKTSLPTSFSLLQMRVDLKLTKSRPLARKVVHAKSAGGWLQFVSRPFLLPAVPLKTWYSYSVQD